MKSVPTFTFEKKLWATGTKFIGGVDEVGRGALAGPVVAGCVIFPQFANPKPLLDLGVTDSKQMTPQARQKASSWIKTNCLSCGIGQASVDEINTFGIVPATNIAFKRAVLDCKLSLDHLLTDAFYIPNLKNLGKENQTPFIKGDCLSLTIAAASIVAKTYRDFLLTNLSQSQEYSIYNWANNKGYGTSSHRQAIKDYGATNLHRLKFISNLT